MSERWEAQVRVRVSFGPGPMEVRHRLPHRVRAGETRVMSHLVEADCPNTSLCLYWGRIWELSLLHVF